MEEKKREGVSVKEIEFFARKHRFEVFFCVMFVLACFFSLVMWGAWWAIFAATVGAILGVLVHTQVEAMSKKILHFVFKQEKTTQLVLGIVGFILSIFIPPLIFLIIGLHGGKDLYRMATNLGANPPQ